MTIKLFRISTVLVFLLGLVGCDQTTTTSELQKGVNLIPFPKEIIASQNILIFSEQSRIHVPSDALVEVAVLMRSEIQLITGIQLGMDREKSKYSDLLLIIDPSMAKDAYSLTSDKVLEIKGGSPGSSPDGQNYLASAG